MMGEFRVSSIDSIIALTNEIKGDSVTKRNTSIMSGGMILLDIKSIYRNLYLLLDNAHDSTAQKIVYILNSYIFDENQKLYINNITPKIIDIR
jgi:hypothetical protein